MTTPTTLPYSLERTISINAPPETVFRFFTDPERWAKWWGKGSTVEPKPGGDIYIHHPGGIESRGNVVSIDEPKQFVFTYGFVGGNPIPPGSSLVTISLEPMSGATRLTLRHELPDEKVRDEHQQGWRFQLSLFANVVADEIVPEADKIVDLWLSAWSEPDPDVRATILEEIAAPSVTMRDRFSNLDGVEDVLPHIAASQRFMPGLRLRRSGKVRHCQGMILADWVTEGPDGSTQGSGTNVFELGPDGLIESVTGFWTSPGGSGT